MENHLFRKVNANAINNKQSIYKIRKEKLLSQKMKSPFCFNRKNNFVALSTFFVGMYYTYTYNRTQIRIFFTRKLALSQKMVAVKFIDNSQCR